LPGRPRTLSAGCARRAGAVRRRAAGAAEGSRCSSMPYRCGKAASLRAVGWRGGRRSGGTREPIIAGPRSRLQADDQHGWDCRHPQARGRQRRPYRLGRVGGRPAHGQPVPPGQTGHGDRHGRPPEDLCPRPPGPGGDHTGQAMSARDFLPVPGYRTGRSRGRSGGGDAGGGRYVLVEPLVDVELLTEGL
jgi:hypothetical protein